MTKRRLGPAAILVASLLTALPGGALAAGFEYGPQGLHAVGRGGAFTVAADDASAIYWNPARLALFNGTQAYVSLNMSLMDTSFTRADVSLQRVTRDPDTGQVIYGDFYNPQPEGFPHSFETVTNSDKLFPLGASVFLVSDFGLKDWGFGIGFHAPTATGKVTFPNTFDSANKYMFSSMDTIVMYVDFSAAWKYKEWFGLGVTFQYVMVPYLKYQMAIMGPASYSNQNTPVNNSNDIITDVNVSDWGAFSMIAGFWVRPLQMFKGLKKFEIGFNARVVPYNVNATGDITISGNEQSVYANYKFMIPSKLSFTYPCHIQTGIRYAYDWQGRELFDIEVDYVWENWAAMDAFYMKMLEEVEGPGVNLSAMDVTIPRNNVDTHSVRLGGQYNAIDPWLTIRLGTWWESAAQPSAWTNLDLPSWERFGVAVGASTNVYGFEIGFSYNHIFQMPRDVTDGGITQQIMDITTVDGKAGTVMRPGYVVNNGHYEGSIDVFTIGVSYTHKPKAKVRPDEILDATLDPDTMPVE
ncbi:outer membrane protein transport protein [Myxococcota bacterium]|nr:outer membrane protein transport protein [Myxococcota bacterium]